MTIYCLRSSLDKQIAIITLSNSRLKFPHTETFLDTKVYKGERFAQQSRLDIKTHFKATETFQYTHFSSCHPPGIKKAFIKSELFRLKRISLKGHTLKLSFQQLSRKLHLRWGNQQKRQQDTRILPFLTEYQNHTYAELAFNSTTTIARSNIQDPHILSY